MKVLLSAYACEPGRGSEPGNGWNWAISLAELGHQVTVFTHPRGKAAITRELELLEPATAPTIVYIDIPARLRLLCRGQIGVYLHYLFWQRVAFTTAKHRGQPYDVVHHVTWGSLHGFSALWRLGVPFIFGPIGGGQLAPPAYREYFEDGWHFERMRGFLTKYALPFHFMGRRMLKHTRVALGTNDETLEVLRRLGAEQVSLFLDTGISEELIARPDSLRNNNGESLRLLWVARLYPRKGLPLALEALSYVQSDAHLTIIGDGPMRERVGTWINQYGVGSKVTWLGSQDWQAVLKAYEEHDVFLFPTLRDSCPAQLLEAMAKGLPIVTLDHHGSRVLVPDGCGIKVSVDSDVHATARNLAWAIDDLANDAGQRSRMGMAGIEFARQMTWSARARRMDTIYRDVVCRQLS